MELTKENIEQYGFKQINNSMWRKGDITLQNAYSFEGENIYDRLWNIKKTYKACVNGKFHKMIENVDMLENLIKTI